MYHNLNGYNLYAYCYNNPINYVDYIGESASAILGFASLAALIDGPLPIGDIVAVVAVGIAFGIGVAEWETSKETERYSIIEAENQEPAPKLDDKGRPVVEPGQVPTEEDGYIAPKEGPIWDRKKRGWRDRNENVWVPAPTGSEKAHGGGHWDVESPGGGYINVYPKGGNYNGRVSGGKKPYPKLGGGRR